MDKQNQVCDLELAKKIEGLGIKQNGFFSYFVTKIKDFHSIDLVSSDVFIVGDFGSTEKFSAFNATELGELLPANVASFKVTDGASGLRHAGWGCRICEDGQEVHKVFADTEANARAEALIYLIESGKLKP